MMLYFTTLCSTLAISWTTLFAVTSPNAKPWLRLDYPLENARLNSKGNRIAFTDNHGRSLKLLDLEKKQVFNVSDYSVDQSFFWTPDGHRLVYREHLRDPKSLILSRVKAYDLALHKSVEISQFNEPTGVLTFDPRDLRFMILTKDGIHTNRLKFPDQREARWQMASRQVDGKYVVTQERVLWITDGGLTMRKMDDDNSGIQSFDLSPDGLSIVWATKNEEIMFSSAGKKAQRIDYGLDPKWHPSRKQIIFAGARRIGSKTHNFDIKIADINGKSKFLTSSQSHDERWPMWTTDPYKIYFTRAKTTDLYEMEVK